MVHKPVFYRMSCPVGEQQCAGVGNVCFWFVLQVWTGGTVCGSGRHSSWPCPQGVGLGGGIVTDVSRLSGGEGPRGVFDDRDEQIGDLSSPLPHTSLSRHVSVSARSIWWPSAPADPPCASKAETGRAAQHRAPPQLILTPSTCQVCWDHGNKETLWINKHG